ncbi:MAG: ABC transporter ATP-binding protein [Desulfuromonadaceae bacterium]|nr:ABC transporter ATP-binding protein [Desulfuromonadaceae bacterium]MDD2849698.1 ABC transporter ATP-binding protein [Desulfuromonadaceae bacterium]MDD4129801.1 ABC transporter ATP-binding protein [Desulfuromonadaceae bacterium]
MIELLSLHSLTVSFPSKESTFNAVRGISLSLPAGSVLALVGESGSGKTMTALSVMRLVPPPGFISAGEIVFEGQDLLTLPEEALRNIRGRRISMVFQEPMTSLNPVLRIADQLCEPLILHMNMSRRDAHERGAELLTNVGIPSAADRMRDYPHQLSGGMRQRVMIAMALACNPSLLIADEPTTALDVTIQAQILELLDAQRKSSGLSILLITHDLGIVAERADHTAVMYAGQVVESAPTGTLLSTPRHPYTKALLASLPQYAEPGKPLPTLPGQLNIRKASTIGCSFAERCPIATARCSIESQDLLEIAPKHSLRCWKCS